MSFTGFSVLKYESEKPVLAACDACDLKFFTPSNMPRYQVATYLGLKFLEHHCVSNRPKKKPCTPVHSSHIRARSCSLGPPLGDRGGLFLKLERKIPFGVG